MRPAGNMCVVVQQARELVLDIIREKDQGDFRLGRNDFASRLGTSSLDVRAFILMQSQGGFCSRISMAFTLNFPYCISM